MQSALVEVLGWPANRLRVVAPDVGGGFGVKASAYPEEILIPLVALQLGKPVKWIEDRREHLMAAVHSREQLHDIEIAARRDGRIVAVRDRLLVDQGAYNPWGIVQPYNTAAHMLGLFRIPTLCCRGADGPDEQDAACPVSWGRTPRGGLCHGSGPGSAGRTRWSSTRPKFAGATLSGLMKCPTTPTSCTATASHLSMTAGISPPCSTKLSKRLAMTPFGPSRQSLRTRGIFRGIGISSYIEGTGVGPYEGATVYVDASGGVVVATGACSQGQGHETTFAQLAADAIGVPVERVTVISADTAAIPMGVGTFASRSAVVGGNAVNEAATRVRSKLANAAGALLEAAADDIDIEDGQAFVRGTPQSAVPLARVVQSALPTYASPGAVEADFHATVYRQVPTVTYASAVHVALVEVDIETGVVTAATLRRSARLWPRHQPDDRRWPDQRWGGPGYRWRAV